MSLFYFLIINQVLAEWRNNNHFFALPRSSIFAVKAKLLPLLRYRPDIFHLYICETHLWNFYSHSYNLYGSFLRRKAEILDERRNYYHFSANALLFFTVLKSVKHLYSNKHSELSFPRHKGKTTTASLLYSYLFSSPNGETSTAFLPLP